MFSQAKKGILLNEQNLENRGEFEVKSLYFRHFWGGEGVKYAEVDLHVWPNNINHLMVLVIHHFWGLIRVFKVMVVVESKIE